LSLQQFENHQKNLSGCCPSTVKSTERFLFAAFLTLQRYEKFLSGVFMKEFFSVHAHDAMHLLSDSPQFSEDPFPVYRKKERYDLQCRDTLACYLFRITE
jgi:hypothetical protein